MNFWIDFLSVKNDIGILLKVPLCIQVDFDVTDIFTILILLIHENERSNVFFDFFLQCFTVYTFIVFIADHLFGCLFLNILLFLRLL
jgi:hypothetical protein